MLALRFVLLVSNLTGHADTSPTRIAFNWHGKSTRFPFLKRLDYAVARFHVFSQRFGVQLVERYLDRGCSFCFLSVFIRFSPPYLLFPRAGWGRKDRIAVRIAVRSSALLYFSPTPKRKRGENEEGKPKIRPLCTRFIIKAKQISEISLESEEKQIAFFFLPSVIFEK